MSRQSISSRLVVLAIALATLCAPSWAQGKSEAAKIALIRELLQLTGAVKVATDMMKTMEAQLDQAYPQIVAQAVQSDGVKRTQQQRDALVSKMLADRDSFDTVFRAKLEKKLNMPELLEKTYFPLYDKYFTESELREIVKFQKSPLGQKQTKVMPDLIKEAIQQSSAIVTGHVQEALKETMEEQKRSAAGKGK